ncbi:MAG: archaeosine biosynthesis radical SAM protein RaSEA [Candidatus Wallbacteria bacterium]|nr:archaeosine biosynthesis radical SAM protein RaSEA [Candidatus Wallbacteria bacterium]
MSGWMEMDADRIYELARERVRALNLKIKGLMPPADADLSKPPAVNILRDEMHGRIVRRAVITLTSRGCEWAHSEKGSGGCTMCGHYLGTTRGRKPDPYEHAEQFRKQFESLDHNEIEWLCLYNSGNFLNPEEVDPLTRGKIYDLIADYPNIRRLTIETRPEFVNELVLRELNQYLGQIEVEIGIGIETTSDLVRDLCINKGYGYKEFSAAVDLINSYHLKPLAYALMKPAFMTEYEAILNTLSAVAHAFESGVKVVSIEAGSIQDYTLLDYLYKGGQYEPPMIWSVIEVVRMINSIVTMGDSALQHPNTPELRIGGYVFFPVPLKFSQNCGKCNQRAMDLIEQFNLTNDIKVFESYSCDCREVWITRLRDRKPPYPVRINSTLDELEHRNLLAEFMGK